MSDSAIMAACHTDDAHQQPRGARMPDLFLEDGWSDDAFGGDPLWQEPNTFPMLRVDIRWRYEDDGTRTYFGGHISAADFGRSVANRVGWFWGAVAATWPTGKPRRYALILVGFDYVDSDLYVGQHTDDRYGPAQASAWSDNAAAESRPYMQACWADARSRLASGNLPMPARLFTNIESMGDIHGSVKNIWEWMEADPRWRTSPIGTALTAEDWAAAHATNAAGDPIPAFNDGEFGASYSPKNWDYAHRCLALVQRGYLYAIERIICEPFRAVFGARPCGEWNFMTGTRSAPVLFRPNQHEYQHDGASQSMIIPASYASPRTWRGREPTFTADDARWETLENYAAAFPPEGATDTLTTWALARAVTAAQVAQLRAAASAEIVPSVGQWSVGRVDEELDKDAEADKAAFAPYLAGLIADAWRRGATAFWLFEPYWPTAAEDRAAVAAYVAQANARIRSGDFT